MQKKNSSCLYSFLKGCYKFLQAFDRLTSHPLITFLLHETIYQTFSRLGQGQNRVSVLNFNNQTSQKSIFLFKRSPTYSYVTLIIYFCDLLQNCSIKITGCSVFNPVTKLQLFSLLILFTVLYFIAIEYMDSKIQNEIQENK